MKKRSGFVSNSSSSSFLIIGIKVSKDSKIYQDYKENDYEMPEKYLVNGLDYLSDDGPGYYGEVIEDTGSDGYFSCDVSLSEEDIKVAREKFPEDLQDEVRIICGTRSC